LQITVVSKCVLAGPKYVEGIEKWVALYQQDKVSPPASATATFQDQPTCSSPISSAWRFGCKCTTAALDGRCWYIARCSIASFARSLRLPLACALAANLLVPLESPTRKVTDQPAAAKNRRLTRMTEPPILRLA
jgi:hypothetical protein